MPLSFERSPLWQRTLADCPADRDCVPRQSLRLAYLQFRAAVAPLAAEISRSLPMFTDHSIAHADALWDAASLICGDSFQLNPAEAFVLGGAFLLHDVGMGLASYLGGTAAIEADPHFADLLASATARLRRADPSASSQAIESAARQESVAELLRLRHAAQAENLVTTTFQTSDGEPFFLLGDVPLRQTFGSLIGRIAHSHWWPVNDLRALDWQQGSCPDHPPAWEVDPLKIACVLRLADAAHIDSRRAPTYLHAFRRPAATSHDHWYFQERLTRPRVNADRLEYTATRPFGRNESCWSGWELMPEGLRMTMNPPEGLIYVGGYQADEIYHCMGAFAGRPLTADRLRAWPVVTMDTFQAWIETQAERIRDSRTSTSFDREEIGYLARGLGAVAPGLPCAQSRSGPLDRDALADWLTGRQEVLLLAAGTMEWMNRSDGKTLFFTFDGRQLYPPDNALLLLINPPWLFPEEVLARPRDERFAHAVQSPSTWNLDAWWYDTGNFGGVGLTVRTIAEAWQLSIEDAVRLMEPLHVQGDRDLRPRIETDDGESIRVVAIRMRRPPATR